MDANGNVVEQLIKVNNSFDPLYEDIELLYGGEKTPACIGLVYDVDPGDLDENGTPVEKLQWRELECDRYQNVMCEVDFRNTQRKRAKIFRIF